MEIRRIIETSQKPSIELQKLSDAGLLVDMFPELSALDYVRPGPVSHKNNYYHTLQVLDHVAAVSNDPILRWAAVLHDIGKPGTQALDPGTGHWTFWKHASLGSKLAAAVLPAHQVPADWIQSIRTLVYLHMRPVGLVEKSVTPSAVRRLCTEAGPEIWRLLDLAEADITSRAREQYLKNLAEVRNLVQIVMARDLWENTRPVLNGTWMLENLDLPDTNLINPLKDHMKHAILEQGVPNTPEALWPVLEPKLQELGICLKKVK